MEVESEGVEEAHEELPVCLIILGMAGSGKTTFVKKLSETLSNSEKPPYIVNLDPACLEVPYKCHVG